MNATIEDVLKIKETVTKYVQGTCGVGDEGLALEKEAFYEKATMNGWYSDGTMAPGPIQALFDQAHKNATCSDYKYNIDILDISDTVAVTRVIMKKRARVLLDEVGIDMDLDQRADHVSIARQQMIEIARALNLETKIIIFDEPTSSLTTEETDKLFLLMRQLRAKDIGMVYISHRMDEIYKICDRITLMRDGKVIFTDEIANVDNHRLLTGIVGKENTNQFPEKPL